MILKVDQIYFIQLLYYIFLIIALAVGFISHHS